MSNENHTSAPESTALVALTVQHEGRGYELWQRAGEEDRRVLDLDLARWAEMKNPSNILAMLDRYGEDLASMGDLYRLEIAPPSRGGKARQASYLNEAQALYLLAKMETPKAKAMLKTVIAVFLAARRGAPSGPSFDWQTMQAFGQTIATATAQAVVGALTPVLQGLRAPAPAAPLPAAPPPLALRAQVVRLHRAYCIDFKADHREAWSWMLREFRDRHHFDAKARAQHRKCNSLDVLEQEGKLQAFYDLIKGLIDEKKRNPTAHGAAPDQRSAEDPAETDRVARETLAELNKLLEEPAAAAPPAPGGLGAPPATRPRSERNANRRPRSVGPLAASMLQAEREAIIRALHKHKGNNSRTALELRVSRRSLYDKITDHGLRELADELRVKNGVMGPRSTVQKKAA